VSGDLTALFVENVRKIRKARGLTAEALAALCPRLDRAAISKIENGFRRVTLDDVAQLAAALQVQPDAMLRYTLVTVAVTNPGAATEEDGHG
jgi:transcriptional regulator with XRE-family HTH domain